MRLEWIGRCGEWALFRYEGDGLHRPIFLRALLLLFSCSESVPSNMERQDCQPTRWSAVKTWALPFSFTIVTPEFDTTGSLKHSIYNTFHSSSKLQILHKYTVELGLSEYPILILEIVLSEILWTLQVGHYIKMAKVSESMARSCQIHRALRLKNFRKV